MSKKALSFEISTFIAFSFLKSNLDTQVFKEFSFSSFFEKFFFSPDGNGIALT